MSWANFYTRLQKQYRESPKPYLFEFSLTSAQPKPRKLMVMIQKLLTIIKTSMIPQYNQENELTENYWDQIARLFKDTHQVQFITTRLYEKRKTNIKILIALWIFNKTIFNKIEAILTQLKHLYISHQERMQELSKDLEPFQFLKDGQYSITGDLINDYETFHQEKVENEKIQEIQLRQKEKEKREQEEREKAKQLQKQIEEEREEQRKREEEEKRRQIQEKLQEENRKNKISLSDYMPTNLPETYVSKQPVPNYTRSEDPQLITKKCRPNQKHSLTLYREVFQGQAELFSFKLKPQESQQKEKCFQCHEKLSGGLYVLGVNKNYCHYTGEWFCNNDFSENRVAIPWKAIEQFDLKGYGVSKVAYEEIRSYYEKPIIEIKNNSEVVRQHPQLYSFLLLRRQIHLMYDAICNTQLIQPLLAKKLNYCLKMNLLSLKNLYDIYNGREQPILQQDYQILSKHFYRCQICQKKRGYICPKCNDPVKIFPFELKETHGCKACRKLYHRKCLNFGQCDCTNGE